MIYDLPALEEPVDQGDIIDGPSPDGTNGCRIELDSTLYPR